jgi:hypothetical protein
VHALPGAVEVLNVSTQRKGTIDQAMQMHVFSISSALGPVVEIKLEGMDYQHGSPFSAR